MLDLDESRPSDGQPQASLSSLDRPLAPGRATSFTPGSGGQL
jgi:hypothetical protein